MKKQLAVLGYHKIGPPVPGGWETWYYVSEQVFVSHLTILRDGGWHVLDVSAMLRGLEDPDSLPALSAMITFDDGYRCILEHATPHLKRFGFPAVIFVPTKFIAGLNAFDDGAEPDERICDWPELRKLEDCGVSVQSHTVSHPWLSKLESTHLEEELSQSKSVLETALRKSIELFAYPFGDVGTDPLLTKRILDNLGYRAAFLYGGGPNPVPIADRFGLERLAIGPDTELQIALASSEAPANAEPE